MRKSSTFTLGVSYFAMAMATPVIAQEANETRLDDVVITGSFIAGSPEDAALPVDVINADDLELQGNPSLNDLIRNLGISSGVDGATNQFTSNGLEGTSNVNLRGLGPARTLVLINGRRQTFSPFSIGEQAQLFVDINAIPQAAIGRIEVLKDGAAALYGSDAIAGVVNFITRTDLDGFEFSADYEFIDGSDGNYALSGAYGWQGENANWITSIGFTERNELPVSERDWALRSFADNPEGGWSTIGNPGSFVAIPNIGPGVAVAGTPLAFANSDDQCAALGGVDGNVLCRFQYTNFDNLIEKEQRIQIFSEFNYTFDDNMALHVEALFANAEVPEWKTSPSYPPQQLFGQIVSPSHPGLIQYIADNPAWATATYTDFSPFAAGGAPIPGGLDAATTPLIFFGRTFGNGGLPGGKPGEGRREHSTFRLAADLTGSFENGVNWDAGLTYSRAEAERFTPDTFVYRLSQALSGLGGSDCEGQTPGENGCLYYNPFSNAIPFSAVNGATNPQYRPELSNSQELRDWLTGFNGETIKTSLLVIDTVFNGELGWELGGGAAAWASGFQLRRETYEVNPLPDSNLEITPCTTPGDTSCANPTGPFAFLAGRTPFDGDQSIWGAFVELQLPLTENFDVQLAARYESYEDDIGDTFDPKIAAKWQVTDHFALRGSAQTSFHGPTLNQLSGQVTTLQFVAPTGAFKAVDQFGNPNLAPESATSFNIGGLFELGDLSASADYWNFDFTDPIIVESQDAVVAGVLAALADPNGQDILNRVTFDGNVQSAGTISRIRTNIVNGPDIKTSGLDIRLDYHSEDLLGAADIRLGVEASYILEYDVGAYQIEDAAVSEIDAIGKLNRDNFLRPVPEWKANAYAVYTKDRHTFRADIRHITSYEDQRPTITGNGKTIDSFTMLDVTYNVDLYWDIDAYISIQNLTDENPPLARLDLSYDPYTHPSYGRVVKFGFTKTFGN